MNSKEFREYLKSFSSSEMIETEINNTLYNIVSNIDLPEDQNDNAMLLYILGETIASHVQYQFSIMMCKVESGMHPLKKTDGKSL